MKKEEMMKYRLLDREEIVLHKERIITLIGICLDTIGYDQTVADEKYKNLLINVSNNTGYLIGAMDRNELVAMCWAYVFERHKAEEFHIAYISCLPEYRKTGIGTQLIFEAEKLSKILGIFEIGLNVDTSNTTAIQFYQKNGFEESTILYKKRIE